MIQICPYLLNPNINILESVICVIHVFIINVTVLIVFYQ